MTWETGAPRATQPAGLVPSVSPLAEGCPETEQGWGSAPPSRDCSLCCPLSHLSNSSQCCWAGGRALAQAVLGRVHPVGVLLKCSRYVLLSFSPRMSVCPVWWVGTLVLPAITRPDTDTSLPMLQCSFYVCRFFNPTQFTNLVNSAIPQAVLLAQLKGWEHRLDIQAGKEKSAQTSAAKFAIKEKDQQKQASYRCLQLSNWGFSIFVNVGVRWAFFTLFLSSVFLDLP